VTHRKRILTQPTQNSGKFKLGTRREKNNRLALGNWIDSSAVKTLQIISTYRPQYQRRQQIPLPRLYLQKKVANVPGRNISSMLTKNYLQQCQDRYRKIGQNNTNVSLKRSANQKFQYRYRQGNRRLYRFCIINPNEIITAALTVSRILTLKNLSQNNSYRDSNGSCGLADSLLETKTLDGITNKGTLKTRKHCELIFSTLLREGQKLRARAKQVKGGKFKTLLAKSFSEVLTGRYQKPNKVTASPLYSKHLKLP